jgi:hypothetical protein
MLCYSICSLVRIFKKDKNCINNFVTQNGTQQKGVSANNVDTTKKLINYPNHKFLLILIEN